MPGCASPRFRPGKQKGKEGSRGRRDILGTVRGDGLGPEAKPIKGRWDVRAQPIHRWSCSMGRNALAKSGPSKLSWRLQEGRSSPPGVFMLIQKSVIIFFLPLESSSSNMLHLPPASFSSFYIEVLLIYL